ncbi:gephyrin-like molybdotransferase Glp [Aquimarina sp. AU474]|uniref:molybdopterin molybdotransferase MoeA n=1 Tax=Aquimarina sp. AU474 TaxID=2108529 RepID=UPI000D68E005|nr:gephyrin-like molybdotransferase Glp [Aquimarina sp. AU474]
MISVPQALQLVHDHTKKTENITTLPIIKALGHVIVSDIISPIHMPPFRQSAMDGYALGSIEEDNFILSGEIKAGDIENPNIKKGEAIRIFTGAPVPPSAKAVIMQEKVTVSGNQISTQGSVSLHANIRPIGEQIKKGDIALPKGTLITAAGIGYLATLGITTVTVYQKPSIAIITTGNELIPPGQSLLHGQIYESNSAMLQGACTQSGFSNITCYKVVDEYTATIDLIRDTIENHDVILISGGISVGDYDFVGKALRALAVEEVFYKVKQKPGKPLYFAKKQEKIIFALPGNPASSLSCFYIYVLPALLKTCGNTHSSTKRGTAISNTNYSKKGERAEFLKAIISENNVTILDGQASSMLRSFSVANAMVYLPEEVSNVEIGDPVQIVNLP